MDDDNPSKTGLPITAGAGLVPDQPPAPAEETVIVKDLQALSLMSMSERFYSCLINKQKVAFRIRPMSAQESAEMDKIDSAVRPPTRQGPGGTTIYLDEDPDYQARLVAARQRKRAAVFSRCLLDVNLKGETLELQAQWLYTHLPIGVIEGLYGAIVEITANPFEDALFTSTVS